MWWHKRAVMVQNTQIASFHVNQCMYTVLSCALNTLMGYISIPSHVTDTYLMISNK